MPRWQDDLQDAIHGVQGDITLSKRLGDSIAETVGNLQIDGETEDYLSEALDHLSDLRVALRKAEARLLVMMPRESVG